MDAYFVKRTDERLEKIEGKIDQLISFRWMLIGMASAVSAVISLVLHFYLK